MIKYLKAMIGTVGEEKLFIASDAVEDRQGECISQEGWDLTNFRANPVIQWAHNGQEPAIATAEKIGFKEINGKKVLVYKPVFHRKTPMSNYIADLVEDGIIKASSVGFKPLEMEGNTYTKSELLEISFVNVPANQNALSLGLSKGYSAAVIKSVMPDVEEEELETGKIKEEKNIKEKSLETTEEKGAVSDELSKEEMQEKKWEKMDNFWNIVYAFCDVYYKDETTPDQFETLLQETVTLLQNLTDGIADTAGNKSIKSEKIDKKDLAKFLFSVEEIKEAKSIKEEEDSEGAACTLSDGTEGTMQMNEDGKMECKPKKSKTEETEEEKSISERIEDLEATVMGLSDGFKKMDSEITEKFQSLVESTESIKNDVKTYLTSQSTVEEPGEKGVEGREPKTVKDQPTQAEKEYRLAMKALNRVVEMLNKTKK
jgi:hypothetical protein